MRKKFFLDDMEVKIEKIQRQLTGGPTGPSAPGSPFSPVGPVLPGAPVSPGSPLSPYQASRFFVTPLLVCFYICMHLL